MKYNERGEELPDPTPLVLPAGARRSESLETMIARLVRGRVSELAGREGLETFEQANDFDIEGDDEPVTAYEQQDMKLEALADERRRLDELEDVLEREKKDADVRETVSRRKAKAKARAAARAAAGDSGGDADEDP